MGLLFSIRSSQKNQHDDDEKPAKQKEETKSFQCPSCSTHFSSTATLRKQELTKHQKLTQPIFIVDEAKGIFLTTKDKSEPRTIIHVCKSFHRQVLDCEGSACREFMAMATGKECVTPGEAETLSGPPPVLI